jgi:formylmethanofuran dehydrogenase subunit E-like metal-binding protein
VTTEPQWEQFLTRNVPHASAPVPQWAHMLIAMTGYFHYRLLAELDEIKELIMTSAESTDQLVQDAVATLVAFETAAQTSLTTLGNDLATVLKDVQAAPNAVQASTVISLQNAITTLGTLGSSLSSNVTSIDTAINPPAPAPAPAPGN